MSRKRSREQQKAIFAALRRRQAATKYGKPISRRLSVQEEMALGDMVRNGTPGQKLRARNVLVASNGGLVTSIAAKFMNRGVQADRKSRNQPLARGFTIKDLIQEGNIGLIKAAERYNPKRGVKFGTFATYWIRQSIERAMETRSREITTPGGVQWQFNKVRKAEQTFLQKAGREPTETELVNMTGLTYKQIQTAKQLQFKMASTSRVIGDEGEGGRSITLEDTLPNPEFEPSALDKILGTEDHEKKLSILRARVGRLSMIERQIVAARYLDGESADKVGKRLKLTRQRINQLENSALHKLKSYNDPRDSERPKRSSAVASSIRKFISSFRRKK